MYAAASLKRGHFGERPPVGYGSFRGMYAAASLKPALAGLCAVGSPRMRLPRRACRGLIEALYG